MNVILKTAGAVIAGTSHIKNNKPCQDSIYSKYENKTMVSALSDGAGSCSKSEIGSELCTRYIADFFCNNFNTIYKQDKKNISETLVLQLKDELKKKAEKLKISVNDLSSTLLFVAVKNNKFIAGHIGDGLIGSFHDTGARVFSAPENGEHGNETFFITQNNALDHFRIYKGNLKSIIGFILMSDGSYDNLFDKRNNNLTEANLSFFSWIADTNNSEKDVENALKETLENKFIKKTTDDCSVILLSTEHREGYIDKILGKVAKLFLKNTRFNIL